MTKPVSKETYIYSMIIFETLFQVSDDSKAYNFYLNDLESNSGKAQQETSNEV